MNTFEETQNLILDLYNIRNSDYYWFKLELNISKTVLDNTLAIVKLLFDLLNLYPSDVYPDADDGYFLTYKLINNTFFYVRVMEDKIDLCYNIRQDLTEPAQKELIDQIQIDENLKNNLRDFINNAKV